MKKKIIISSCLLGENCRYDGQNCKKQIFIDSDVEWLPVCPEVEGNLGIPRFPAELQGPAEEILQGKSNIINTQREDITKSFIDGAKKCLKITQTENTSIAILKSHSPSCGPNKIYDGSFSRNLISGSGIFAHLCTKAGLKVISSDDLEGIQKIIGKK